MRCRTRRSSAHSCAWSRKRLGATRALIGASACRLQGAEAASPNLEFMTTRARATHARGDAGHAFELGPGYISRCPASAFHARACAVFVFANPVFHGRYESLSPMEIPSLWDARARIEVEGAHVLATPLEWELLFAVMLDSSSRIEALRTRMREHGFDNRLLTRLLREGHVPSATEEAVWAVLETPSTPPRMMKTPISCWLR